ncbi:MAG: SH3 domain-containing protein [Pyrinomonadaceae bacterium]
MYRNLRQSIFVLTAVTIFLALGFAVSAESSAQTSKKSGKPTPTPKKTTKATPTPSKKTSAKAAATKSKVAEKKIAEKKTAEKKSPAKSDLKNQTPKDKNKNRKEAAKNTKNTKIKNTKEEKLSAAKTSRSSKSSESSQKSASKTALKSKDSKSAKNSKTETIDKKSSAKKIETRSKIAAKPKPKIEETSETAELPQIMVTDISAQVRSQPKAAAPELGKVKLGTVLDVLQKNGAWYKVRFLDDGKTSVGWIPAGSIGNFDAAHKGQNYSQTTNRYYKPDGMDFATSSALYESLTRNQSDFETSGSAADLQLKRLLALRAALKAIPAGAKDSTPYKEFLRAHDKEIVYSEPAGEYLVTSNLFWDLHKKYKDTPLADQIAWAAAQNPLPGECEGYVNCHLFYGRMTNGEYLNLHPTGKNNLEALTNLTNMLEPIVNDLNAKAVYNGPTDVTDRAEFNNLIAELRTIVSRLPLTEKEKTLQQLKSIAEGFR